MTSCIRPDCNKKVLARGLCSGHYTRFRRADPEAREIDAGHSRKWKANNVDRVLAYNRAYDATHKGECTTCAGPMNRQNDGGVCPKCLRAARNLRREIIVDLWNSGYTIKGIASTIGSTTNAIGTEMARMRREGEYNLPHRQRVSAR